MKTWIITAILFTLDYLVSKKLEVTDLLFWIITIMFNFWLDYILKNDE